MVDYNKQIEEIEKELAKMQYNKRTQHHYGLLRAKIAKIKEKDELRSSKSSGKKDGFEVRKTGDGTVLLLGFPSVGKSTLLNAITDAESEVGAYAFTTLTVVPGTLDYKHAKIQILDVPGIVKGAASGRGRGKEVLASMRSADLCLIIIDATRPHELNVINKEVYDANIRLDQRPPHIKIIKTGKDGIKIGATCKITNIDEATIKAILKEFKINNADIVLREDINADQFIDVLEKNKVYMPSVLVINKIDLVSEDERKELIKKYNPDLLISAKNKDHLDELKELIYKRLNLINIFLKEPSKDPDMDVPLIMFSNCSIRDVCNKLHKDFVSKFKFARVWGKSAKFPGQRLMLHHRLKNNDILEVHLR